MLAHQRYYVIAISVFLVVSACSFYLFRTGEQPVVFEKIEKAPFKSTRPTLRDTISSLFEPIIHDPSSPGFIDASGTFWKAGNETVWTEPLGKKVLIVDIDTRIPTGDNQILNPETLDWRGMDMHGGGLVSNAILNHYIWALIHGYDYKFYQAQHMPDQHDTWIMPHVFRELLPDYQFVVAMDADVTIPNLEVPIEWMFNRWGVKNHTSIALPWDTEELRNGQSISLDSKGLLVLNTGFVAVQNSEITLEMLEAWRDCTSEERYPGCARWAYEWSHEQRAFSEYIRYDFNHTPETVVSIPCDDAVGYPGFKELAEPGDPGISDCRGNFVRHYTFGKEAVKEAGAAGVMQVLAQVLQRNILQQQESMWVKETKSKKLIAHEAAEAQKKIEEEARKKIEEMEAEKKKQEEEAQREKMKQIEEEAIQRVEEEEKQKHEAEEKLKHAELDENFDDNKDEGKDDATAPVVIDGYSRL